MHLLAVGALLMLGASFGLGFFVAGRQLRKEAQRGLAMAKSAAVGLPSNEQEVTVRIPTALAKSQKSSGTTRIEPTFYEELLANEKPNGKKMGPLKLVNVPAFKSSVGPDPKPPLQTEYKTPKKAELRVMPTGLPTPTKAMTPPKRLLSQPRLFTIQVFSVQKPRRAINIMRGLRDKGFSAFIQRVELKGKGAWLRIRVGRFSDRKSALRTLQSLRKKISARGAEIVPL